MVTLLSKLLIKNHNDIKSAAVRKAYGMLCGCVGIALNIFLFLGKFLAGTLSHSISITADAFNNLSDAGSSFITLIGFKLSAQKPDTNHPFGHGRIEYLSGLIVSMAILLMAVGLIKSSVDKIVHPVQTQVNTLVILILIVSILVKFYMNTYNRHIGKTINSAALLATAADSRSDSLATLFVLISSLISKYSGYEIDGYCGLIVGILILYSGFGAAKDTINPLLGQPPSKEFVEEIESIVLSHKKVLGIHDLVVHDYGPGRIMISLHAEVSASGDILDIHDMIDQIETELGEKLSCEAVIHMDPITVNDPEVDALKELVARMILQIDESLHFHDFRIVKGPTHTNLIFDVLAPYKFRMSDDELMKQLSSQIHELDDRFFAVIKIDHSFVV